MIETRASMLLIKGFIKTIADLTFENINDVDFCQKTSYILRVLTDSLCKNITFNDFYFEIREFELLSDLLLNYRDNEDISLNTIHVFGRIFRHSYQIKFTKKSLESFFGSEFFDIIDFHRYNSQNDSLVSECYSTFHNLELSNNNYLRL